MVKKGIITDRDKLIEAIEKVLTDAEIMANIKVKSAYLSITGAYKKYKYSKNCIKQN